MLKSDTGYELDSDPESDNCCSEANKSDDDKYTYHTFTYNQLLSWILEFCEDEAAQRVNFVASWKLKSTESFLKSMLLSKIYLCWPCFVN